MHVTQDGVVEVPLQPFVAVIALVLAFVLAFVLALGLALALVLAILDKCLLRKLYSKFVQVLN